jgi:hypothetical protein
MKSNIATGQAGVMRACAELLIRGYHPLVPTVDDGADLYLENGHIIQVKSAHLVKDEGRYSFNFKRWKLEDGRRTQQIGWLDPKVTIVILWGINTDTLWIIPAKEIRGIKQVNIKNAGDDSRPSKYNDYINAWELIVR